MSKPTFQRYLPKKRKQSSQTWATFLKSHAAEIWACDFTVVHDLFFRPTYIFIVIELHTRRILHTAVTLSPTDARTAQQLRVATPWGMGPKYLLHDCDRKYGRRFAAVAASSGIKELRSPIRAPKANAICERINGSLKRECLDHMLILHRSQVRRLVNQYATYYNLARPNQAWAEPAEVALTNGCRITVLSPSTLIRNVPLQELLLNRFLVGFTITTGALPD